MSNIGFSRQVGPLAKIAGGYAMRSKMLPFALLAGVLAAFLFASSCGNGSSTCPVCGTDKNGTVGLINIMLVPEHNATGEPGGPFNSFDIGWVDPVNRLYYITDRVGLDVPMFSTTTNIALAAIGGDNSVGEAGNNVSLCFVDPESGITIPSITTAQGNYTRFGCKTGNFRLPGGFGPNGHFGGFMGGQCCASRSNNLNPLTGPNGLEVTADGVFMFVGTGSSNVVVFDMTATLATPSSAPTVIATVVTGTSPDYDGIPDGITGCMQSANGRAFSDPTCGDLRADELSTGVATAPDGSQHFLVLVTNGDPGLPFATIFDATHIVNRTGTLQQQHCLPYNQTLEYSPGGVNTTFPKNLSSCILGQIYYDAAFSNDINTVIDDQGANGANGIVCPDPSLQFAGPPGVPGQAVPSGASGHAAGFNPNVPCHHGPQLTATTPTQVGGVFCAPGPNIPAGCVGAVGLAGLGGSVFNPNTGHFLLTNGNAIGGDVTVGSVDEIDPFHTFPGGPVNGVPAVINSFPVPSCMPTGVAVGPGTDVLVTCAGHDGREFAPTTYIINGTTGAILATINNVGGVDQGWFNPGDGRYYEAARDMPTGPVLGVIDARSRQWLQNVPTNSNSHSVAADAVNNHIFVPLAAGGICGTQNLNGCVGVYARQ
jgi:hypothetical protein